MESVSQGRELSDSAFKYSTVSIKHLKELRDDIDVLDNEGKLSDNKTFRRYIAHQRKYAVPESFPNSQSVLVLAVFTPLALVDFHHKGKQYQFMLPPQYYDDGTTEEQLRNTILSRIIGKPEYKVERANMHFLLKRLAVRSGLGKYGRSNLCYVDGFGSLLTLYAYLTDFSFPEDDWNEVQMMDACSNCQICMKECPLGCITEDNFVIDVGRCVTLYNEIDGEFPKWISPTAHNSLMGCMKCQLNCPANRSAISKTLRLEDVSEEETAAILEGSLHEGLLQSLSRKLRDFSPTQSSEAFPVLTRNLRVLMEQQS